MRLKSIFSAILVASAIQFGASQSWVTFIDSLTDKTVYDITELPDGSLFFTGGYGALPQNGYPLMVYGKLNGQGGLLWLKTNPDFIRAEKVFNRQDRIFVFAYDVNWLVSHLHYLLELDKEGAVIAQKQLGPSGTLSYDLDFDAVGNIYISYIDYPKERLMKLDVQLNTVWDIEIGDSNVNEPFSTVRVMPDGAIQWCGYAFGSLKIIRFSSNGVLLSTYVAASPNSVYRVNKAQDGGFFLTKPGASSFFAQKIDQLGNLVWFKELYRGNQFYNTQFSELSTGTLILFGTDYKIPSLPFFITPFLATFTPGGEPLYRQDFRLDDSPWYDIYGLQPIGQGAVILGANMSVIEPGDGPMALAKWDSTLTGLTNWAKGNVFLDENQNCKFENGELNFQKAVVRASGSAGSFYSVSDSAGRYRILLPDGQFNISAASPNAYFTACPDVAQFMLSGQTDSVVQNFAFKKIINCTDLTAELTIPRLRRCFENPASVHFCNLGTIPATDAHLDLTLDPWLDLTAASQPFTALGGNVFRFELGEMAVFECRDIGLTIKVDCDSTVLGQTHCIEAHIFPDTICYQSGGSWSGASIEVGGVCEADTIRFFIKNVGTATTSVPCEFRVIQDSTILHIWQENLAVGQEIERVFAADGHFWRLEATQEPGYPGLSKPSVSIEGCHGWSMGSLGLRAAYSQDDGSPAVDIDCLQNIGSYDPNEKTAAPEGIDNQHFIQKNQDIEYTIHFQNTGTDTAFTVVVTDTIDQKLRPETLKLGGASHPFSWEIYGPGILKMSFEKINLPDSTTNLAGSQGWFSYRISQKPDLEDGSQIRNRAAIFFDFNPPILTNRTLHTIGSNFLTVKTWSPAQPNTQLSVFPNPTSDEATFLIKGDKIGDGDALVLQLFDVNGRLVLAKNFTKNSATISCDGLGSGLYFFKINSGNGAAVGAGKLLIE